MSKLFQPTKLGRLSLSHRVVMAPMTRVRANTDHVPSPTAPLYYSQRGSTPGTLLITESTPIAQKAGGLANTPGIWSNDQLHAWRNVTDAVHANGSFIYVQLWALGRTASEKQLKSEDPALQVVSASDIPIKGRAVPRPLTRGEIQEYVELFATAAENAITKAGFDGVEIHNAGGYLLDQFLQINSNIRTDEYGGSVQNRSRFTLEVLGAITQAIGGDRTGIRFSPWSDLHEMRMSDDAVYETFSYIVTRIRDLVPHLAYIHLIEPSSSEKPATGSSRPISNDFINDIWAPLPLIRNSEFDRTSAMTLADKTDNLVSFARHFLANPDLPKRLKYNLPLNPYDRSTFYLSGDQTGRGYTDYPFIESNVRGK